MLQDRKMKILGLINRNSGPGFHRIMMPLLMMEGPDVYITNSVKVEDFEGCDYIYYNRVISNEVLACREKYGFKIVVDVDDYWELDYHHIAYKDYLVNDFGSLQKMHLRNADVVTTTHERLAEKIIPYNNNVIVVPNAIPNHEYFAFNKTESERVRIFWQGSITHEKDIELLRGPVKRLDPNKVMMVMAGYTKHEAWDRMVSTYTSGLKLNGSILPGTATHLYYHNYSFADICLAPLVESQFNSFKSNLKILEAAHAGLPVIASAVHPYHDMPVLYAEKQSDWFKYLNKLINNPELRKDIGQNLKEFCNRNYNFQKINQKRKEIFI